MEKQAVKLIVLVLAVVLVVILGMGLLREPSGVDVAVFALGCVVIGRIVREVIRFMKR